MITSPDKIVYSSTTVIGKISVHKMSNGLFKVSKDGEVLGIYETRDKAFARVVNVFEGFKSELTNEIFLISHETKVEIKKPDPIIGINGLLDTMIQKT